MKRIYFEWMWFWCWACYRIYTAIPAPDIHASHYGRFNMWLLGYAGAYANSSRADFHLCNFFYRNDAEQKLAWETHLAIPRPHRETR